MNSFEKVIYQIESRKREIYTENIIHNMMEFNFNAEITNDDIINNLYNKLEKNLVNQYKYKNKFYTINELAKISMTNVSSLRTRIVTLGWDIEKAMFTPFRKIKRRVIKQLST